MESFLVRFGLSVFLVLGISSCGSSSSAVVGGGVVGGALGAGTGAIIGSAIKNGAVGQSALLGTAIGVPVGVLIAAVVDYNSEENQQKRHLETLKKNQQLIFEQERLLEKWRAEVLKNSPRGLPSEHLADHLYTGPTLGNPYR